MVEGQVATLQPYGAFINLGDNMNGLLHISQISHDRISSVEQVLQVGQKVKVGPPPASHALLITADHTGRQGSCRKGCSSWKKQTSVFSSLSKEIPAWQLAPMLLLMPLLWRRTCDCVHHFEWVVF